MGGTALKVAIGAFLVWLSTQMGAFADEILGRVRESVQASELLSIDGAIYTWSALDNDKARSPRDQAEFERVLKENLSAGGGRDVTRDRWDEPYVYDRVTTKDARSVCYRITSKGPDRRLGTADDLVVERTNDSARINRDPVKIAEAAIARKKQLDHDVAVRVRALLDQAKLAPPPPEKPSSKAPEKDVSPETLARDLGAATRLLGTLVPSS